VKVVARPARGTIVGSIGLALARVSKRRPSHAAKTVVSRRGRPLAALMLSGTASAQSFGIYVGPPVVSDFDNGYASGAPYAYTAPPAYGPRVYGYTRRHDDDREFMTRPAGRCGEYRYWDGDRCVEVARSGPAPPPARRTAIRD
jgi:hypothetical protein